MRHHSVLMGAHADRPATIPTSVLAYQVEQLSVSLNIDTFRCTNKMPVSGRTLLFSQALYKVLQTKHFSQPDDVAFSVVAGFYFSVLHQLPVCY